MQEKVITGRIYRGSTAQISVQAFKCNVDPSEITEWEIFFFTDNGHSLEKTDGAVLKGNMVTVVFSKEDLDIMNDGVIRYQCNYAWGDDESDMICTNTNWVLKTPEYYHPSEYPSIEEVEEIVGEKLTDYYTKEEIDAKADGILMDIESDEWDREHPERYRFYMDDGEMLVNEIGRKGSYVYFSFYTIDMIPQSIYRINMNTGTEREYWLPTTYILNQKNYPFIRQRLTQTGVIYGQRDNVKILYDTGGVNQELVYLGNGLYTFYNPLPEMLGEHKGEHLCVDFDFTKSQVEDAITERYEKSPFATNNEVDDKIAAQKFKTINGETITGEGDIVIQGGGSQPSVYFLDFLDRTSTDWDKFEEMYNRAAAGDFGFVLNVKYNGTAIGNLTPWEVYHEGGYGDGIRFHFMYVNSEGKVEYGNHTDWSDFMVYKNEEEHTIRCEKISKTIEGGSGGGVTPEEVQEKIDASLTDYYNKSQVDGKIPTKTSQLTNDAGYVTANDLTEAGVAFKDEIPTKTSQLENDSNFLTEHQDISGKVNNINGVTGIWRGTKDAYDALAVKDNNVFYIIEKNDQQ